MKPDMNNWLTMLGARAMAQAARETDQLEASRWGLIAAQAGVATHEFENGAANRIAEIEGMKNVITEVAASAMASTFDPASLDCRHLTPESLKITDVDAAIDRLRKAITAIHEVAETLDSEQGRALESRIWAAISQSIADRRVPGNLFDQ